MTLWSRAWWRNARDNAIRTAAASALGALGADAVIGITGIDPVHINWQFVVTTALLGGLVSFLSSVSGGTIEARRNGKLKP